MKKLLPFLLSAAMAFTPLAGCISETPGMLTASAAGHTLSNPNASAETQALYRFLCDTYGNHVISGQQESTWMGSEDYEFEIIRNASGKLPALRGLDYMGDDFSGCNRRAKAWHDKGGIVTICWHCGSDFSGSHTESLNSDLDWDKALTPGTPEYEQLIAGMDKGAKALQKLQQAGVPVIWRPFHEFDGSWFWWGKGGAENFKKLWRIMYDRYTRDWGLDNLIWNLGYCGDVNDGWYPGDDCVDLIGADTYVDHTGSLLPMYQKTAAVADKPVCLHENGPIPDPEQLAADHAGWLWFMTWHTSFVDSNAVNTASYLNTVYNSDYLLTLDELPDVYHYGEAPVIMPDVPEEPSQPEGSGVKGDVNADGAFNLLDVVTLQKWLLGTEDVKLADWKAGDLYEDDVTDVFDLAVMKRLLTAPAEQLGNDFSVSYEAENAAISGNNAVVDDPSASGSKAVGNFADDGDNVTFTVEVPADGCYALTLTAKGLGGDKYNEVLVDGDNIGGFDAKGDTYTDTILHGVMLSAGRHSVSVKKSWGWVCIDKLTVTADEGISDQVYNVSPTLINPNADDNAKALFSYLCESYGKYTLSGQVCNDGLNGAEFKAIYEATGKYPAICGLDMMDYCPSRTAKGAKSNAVETALDFHRHGGIVTFCWHWNAPDKYMKPGDTPEGNPRWWGGFNTSNTDFDIAAVMDGRDPEGKALIDADIQEIAKQLNILRDAGVPVLWRPLHEASGGWFWWGAKGADAYKKLWYYLYDQLTNVYGCSNLIWVWNGQAADWYPGDEYVDVIGEDIYAGERSYGAQNAKFTELLEYSGENKLIALTENGTVFDIDNVVAANAHWMWFGTWCGGFVEQDGQYSEAFTEKSVMRKTYNSEHVITLDELPWNS